MKSLAAVGVLLFVSVPAHAQAQAQEQGQAQAQAQVAKPCEELKDEITKKLDAKGVKGYTLEIVAKDKDADGKTVGACDGGSKKIIYTKTSAPAATPAKEAPKP
jgi:phage-related minor tail protein